MTETLDNTLYVVVAYTPDESREASLHRLIASLNKYRASFSDNLLVFDNASPRQGAYASLQTPARFALSPENLGYWGALKWSLDNAERAFGRTFDYVHPIESDLVLYSLERLAEARRFLERTPDIATVRTQEFSYRSKSRYLKRSWHPFKVRRSWVADYNGATNEPVRFEKAIGFQNIYVTNWHAKVPGLHRFAVLRDVLDELAALPALTEHEFIKAMHRRNHQVAILDRGIWYTDDPKYQKLSGAYSSDAMREHYAYRNSRNDVMPAQFPAISIT